MEAIEYIEDRIENLQIILERFINHSNTILNRMERDTKIFKQEMREDRKKSDESMREDRKKSDESMEAFKKEMREDRKKSDESMREDRKKSDESMEAFKKEMREDRKKAFKQWGAIANKMGTLAEDIVAPSVKEIAEKYFNCNELEDFMVRRHKRNSKDKNKRREFDIIAVCDDKVILIEVKSTPRIQYIDDFIGVLGEFYDYFPEYESKKIIPVFASLYLPDNIISMLTKNNIYAMSTQEDMMDLMNFEEIMKKL